MLVLTIPMISEALNCLKLTKSQENSLLITVFDKIENLMIIILKLLSRISVEMLILYNIGGLSLRICSVKRMVFNFTNNYELKIN